MDGVFFIAEIGLNHNGDLSLAKEMVAAAQESGADAVKFQSLSARSLIARSEFGRPVGGFGFTDVATVGDFWRKVSIGREFHVEINDYCRTRGIEFMSTPFDPESADLLEELGVKRYKIASGDLTYYPLLEYVAKKGKPILLATGASTIGEIEGAIGCIREAGGGDLTLLHCISLYPTPPELANIGAIPYLGTVFNLPVGFSDHTVGWHIPIAAIACGATVVEKHFTLDKSLPGPDQRLSADPGEFQQMVASGREVSLAARDKSRIIPPSEQGMRALIRRSIVAARDLKRGETIVERDLAFKRPGGGVSAVWHRSFVGRKAARDIAEDEQISFGDVQDA
jgi:N,N'-diacetyllegionaminate synthase